MDIRQQTPKQKFWLDEQDERIPFSRTTPVERLKEKNAFELAAEALKLNAQLLEFKETIDRLCSEVFNAVMTEKERKKATKGNFTYYNFDASIKVEVAIDDRITFDSLLIEKCKQKLLSLVRSGISPDKQFLESLVVSAFQTSRGNLDTKKILSLKKHTTHIKDKRFIDAMADLDASIQRMFSKKYFRVWLRDAAGKYNNIDLNFSSVS